MMLFSLKRPGHLVWPDCRIVAALWPHLLAKLSYLCLFLGYEMVASGRIVSHSAALIPIFRIEPTQFAAGRGDGFVRRPAARAYGSATSGSGEVQP